MARATDSGLPRSSSTGPGTASGIRGSPSAEAGRRDPRRTPGPRRDPLDRALTATSEVDGSRGLGRRVERGAHAQLLLDLLLDLIGEIGVVLQEVAGVLLALAELVPFVRVPGTGLLHHALLDADVDQPALAAEALAPEDVELGLLERRGDLVLDDLDPGAAADGVGALLEGLDATDVEADRRVELQRTATGGDLGRAVDDADLLAQLIDEDRRRTGVVQGTGDLAQRLAHEAGLQADVAVTHLALDLGAGHQGGHGVDDDDVEGPGPDQHVGDLERLLPGVGLAHQQGVGVDADGAGVLRVERVLGVDERRDAAACLGVGHRVQGDGRLTGGLRAVDLDDAAAGQAPDAEGDVEGDRTGRDDLDRLRGVVPQPHDRALAELLVDLGEGHVEGLVAVERCHGAHLRFAGSGSVATLGRGTDSFEMSGGPMDCRPTCGRHCRPNRCSIARATRVRVSGGAPGPGRGGAPGPEGTPQRSFGGTSYSSQMASHTFRTGIPASIAWTALRPPSAEKTWSRATLWARMVPN